MPPSNGCAEFTLKNPPPFVPSCLIAIWLATGPPGICWVDPATVCAVVKPCVFWITPHASSTIATTNASGSRMRSVVRIMSTQKLPTVRLPARDSPRISATITAIPAAADTKFWTVRPIICVRWLSVFSPP